MTLHILDDSLHVNIFFELTDCEFSDNICISLLEDCPAEEKIFIHDETNIYLTPDQAESFANLLLTAAAKSRTDAQERCS